VARPSRSPATDDVDDSEPLGRAALDDETLKRREVAGEIEGYRPLVDSDALDARTVLLRLRIAPANVPAVADDLADTGAVLVYELTGSGNLLAVCRFPDDAGRESLLATLATDERVADVNATVAIRTVCERDDRGLL
jgi:DNA-binding Lrp family transcriptional regulator